MGLTYIFLFSCICSNDQILEKRNQLQIKYFLVHLLFQIKSYYINLIRLIYKTKVKFKYRILEFKCYFVRVNCIKQNKNMHIIISKKNLLYLLVVILKSHSSPLFLSLSLPLSTQTECAAANLV